MLIHFAAGLLVIGAAPSSGSFTVTWQWEPGIGICALRQQLAATDVLIELRRPLGTDSTTVIVGERKSQAGSWKDIRDLTVTLEPSGMAVLDGFISYGERKLGRATGFSTRDPKFVDQLSHASSLTLSHQEIGAIRAPLKSPGAALRALLECERRTFRKWGLDPVAWSTLKSTPIPLSKPSGWLTTNDYPIRAVLFVAEGSVVALLDVGTDGTVRKCTVVNQRVLSEFKEAACRSLTRKARFSPALDIHGKPMPAPYVFRIRYEMID